jgi:S1-C subfamily serine protease
MPAARAGLMNRDLVTGINGNPVREQDDLFLNIAAALAGSEVEIEVRRAGVPGTRTVKARLAKSRHDEKVIASARPRAVFGLRVDYTSTIPTDTGAPEGVLVKEVDAGSPAEKKLKAWMGRASLIVVAVDGQPVPTPADFYRAAAGKGSVTLDIVEAGRAGGARERKTLP